MTNMSKDEILEIVTSPVCLCIIAALSIPSLKHLADGTHRFARGRVEEASKVYKDEDGSAAKNSERNLHGTAPKAILCTSVAVGFGAAVSLVTTARRKPATEHSQLALLDAWFRLASWVRQRQLRGNNRC